MARRGTGHTPGARVFAVDDSPDQRQMFEFFLEDAGYEPIPVNDGEQCLALAAANPPDLILLDMTMPGMHGSEVLQSLKANETTCDIPVIMVSAANSENDIVQCLDLGAHDYVAKPVIERVLIARIRAALRLRAMTRKLQSLNRELEKAATTDPLTGIYNRRQWMLLANKELEKAQRHQRPLSVFLLDIDHFKQINDRHGHAVGDRALQEFCRCCQDVMRGSDIFGRYGGEEFIICCPEVSTGHAGELCERIRRVVEAADVTGNDGEPLQLTVSIGATVAIDTDTDMESLILRADHNLYRAKDSGRNRCILDYSNKSNP